MKSQILDNEFDPFSEKMPLTKSIADFPVQDDAGEICDVSSKMSPPRGAREIRNSATEAPELPQQKLPHSRWRSSS